jgi:UTP--glucose-1-phosphate uridylyltransferase
MLPIVDKPVIQYVVEEAVASGITDILMIIGRGKRAIEEHFDRNFELENELQEKGKEAELEALRNISELADVHFVWQKELRGLGDAISYARNHVEDEPFAVLLGDTLIKSEQPVTSRLVDTYDRYQESVVALEQVERSKISRYGVIDGKEIAEGIFLVEDLVEKPTAEKAPSNLAIAGRYVLTPEIFEYIKQTRVGKNNEIQLTDAMKLLVASRAMYGFRFDGVRYDIGNKLDFIRTNIEYALLHEEMKDSVAEFVKKTAAGL